jgi:elongation factor 1-gamma
LLTPQIACFCQIANRSLHFVCLFVAHFPPQTLYTYPGNFRAFKILIAAEYNGITIDVPPFEMMKDNKTPEFLAMSPLGKVPVLKTPQGALFESNAIARYVARMRRDTELYGTTFFASAQVDSWIDFCTHELELAATMWLYPVLGYMPFNPAATAKAKEDVIVGLKTLEAALTRATYLVGDKISLADIVVASALVYPMKLLCDAAFRAPFPNTMRWFMTMVNQAEFKAVVGEVVLCATEAQPAGGAPAAAPAKAAPAKAADPAAAAAAGGKEKAKKEKGGGPKPDPAEIERMKAEAAEKKKNAPPKEKKPDQPKKPKEAKPAAEEDDDGMPKPEKKAPHPFAVLDKEKPSAFVMDTWKKIYSNCLGDYKGAMKQFWELYDAEGWSIHVGRFKYNSENSVAFMCSNSINGFIQRSGEIRKWLFGVHWVTGEEGVTPLELTGCYFIRSQDIEELKKCNDDAEHYNWYKVDTATAEGKALVEEMWCSADGKFEFLEGKACVASSEFK